MIETELQQDSKERIPKEKPTLHLVIKRNVIMNSKENMNMIVKLLRKKGKKL